MDEESRDPMRYKVVVNHEEQYSIWPDAKENPAGWKDAGCSGTKEECLAYVEKVWTDMTPLSLRPNKDRGSGETSAEVEKPPE